MGEALFAPSGDTMDTRISTQALATLLFQVFKREIEKLLSDSPPDETRAYGISHIFGFEETAGAVQAMLPGPLPPLEKLLIRFCTWGRDLGMMKQVKDEYCKFFPETIRKDTKDEVLHKKCDEISAYFIRRRLPDLLNRIFEDITRGSRKEEHFAKYRKDITSAEQLEPFADGFLEQLRQDSGFYSRMIYEAERLAATTNLIAQHHRRTSSIEDCPEQRHLSGETVRARLLAAILRLAKALTIDHTRFEKPYDIFRVPVPREEDRVLWIKSFIISAIRIDAKERSVTIQADLPVGVTRSMGLRQDEGLARLREMLAFIVTDLEEDVLSVSKALFKEGFPLLLGVTCEVQEIPAMSYTTEIRAALDSIYAASSPNTSQLITIALGSLKARLVEAERNETTLTETLDQEVEQQLKDIRLQREQRPCHEGLRKIGNLLATVARLWRQGQSSMEEIRAACEMWLNEGHLRLTLIEGVYQVFVEQRKGVRASCDNVDFAAHLFEHRKHIVVYGYSQQVIDLLEGFFKKTYRGMKPDDVPHIHVLECRTKTIYSSSGRLLYLDGQRYATALRERLKEAPKITLEPDVALGKLLLPPLSAKSEQTLVLLGSNAVYPDGTFVHSMGHTAVAATAKALGRGEMCKVVVVTDSMKIGKIPEKKEEQERNPDVWLTHNRDIVNDLKDRGIELHNWREDRVPAELIDYLIILDKGTVLERDPLRASEPFSALGEMEFDPAQSYKGVLGKRILASLLAHASDRANHLEEMHTMDPLANEHEYNWFAAERFIQGEVEGNRRDDLTPKQLEATLSLNRWIGELWNDKLRTALATLAEDILKNPVDV